METGVIFFSLNLGLRLYDETLFSEERVGVEYSASMTTKAEKKRRTGEPGEWRIPFTMALTAVCTNRISEYDYE